MTTAPTERPIVRPDLLAVLEDGGYRITEPRRNVIAALGQKDEGFSAEELCGELPGVGRATVYRTIKLLQRSGVICKLAMPDGAPKYSLARVDHHHHTICVKCGTVGEFKHATIERLLRAVSQEVSGEIVGHRLEVFISCSDCDEPVRWPMTSEFGHKEH
jgi:Fe2+ or Zn2+ uptake regulation protein